ncbi:phage terminase large subunit family protein [Polaromonas sp.]|uniref:phage terminase large subunit family protein n=1 Tax=Polaromonas sp. TaxID=1869339 RepID=UPI003BB6174C
MNLTDGYKAVMEAAARAWLLPERLSISDWADKYRMVPAKSTSEPGRWRTSRTPYAAEPMNELSSMSRTQEVIIMAASQVLKTEVLLNWMFESIDQDPGPMLIVQPTEKAVKDFVSQRLDPAIEMMPRIRAKIPSSRKRDSGNKITEKNFPGGALYLGWSNSPSELASKPIKKLALDEVDRYPVSLKDEGSPVKLAEQRTANFPRRKILKTSTPKIRGASVITDEYESSSMAQYWVPCPHCKEMQVLQFASLRWKKTIDDLGKKHHWPDTAVYVCEHCGCEIEEHLKPWMLATENGAEWRHREPTRAKRGYHINGLYSPVGLGYSWAERAQKFLDAKDDPVKLQTFVNLHLGEPYEDHSDAVQADALKQRGEPFALRTILPGYLVLTLGVDVQRAGYFALHLVAWGRGERCHTVDYTEIPGDPARSEDWERITEYRRRAVRNAFGIDLRISMTAIDSGDGVTVHEAYKYARKYRHDDVIVVKGHSKPNKPILGRPTKQDVRNERGAMDKNGVDLWMVGTDTAKSALFARLDGDALHEQFTDRMVRYSAELPATFFEGITSEYYDLESSKWVKRPGKRNEPLDTWGYAYAAAHHPRIAIHTAKAADWDELERLYEPRVNDMFAQQAAPVDTSAQVATVPAIEETAAAAELEEEPAAAHEHADWVPDVPDNWI